MTCEKAFISRESRKKKKEHLVVIGRLNKQNKPSVRGKVHSAFSLDDTNKRTATRKNVTPLIGG